MHYYMVYIAYFTELNLQICDYAQKRRICRENCNFAFDENFHGHFCPRRKAAKFCHPVQIWSGVTDALTDSHTHWQTLTVFLCWILNEALHWDASFDVPWEYTTHFSYNFHFLISPADLVVVIVSVFCENVWVLTRTQEVDSTDSINQNVLIQIARRNININNWPFLLSQLAK